MSLLHTLGATPEFRHLSSNELEGVEAVMSQRLYPDGHMFIREGEPGDTLYLVLDGEVVATRAVPGSDGQRNKLLATMGAGDMFGILALVDEGPRAASCRAVGEVLVASLPRERFTQLYKAQVPAAYTFQHMVALQLVHDVRVMNKALAQGMLEADPSEVSRSLEQASYEYRDPEEQEELTDDATTR